MLGVRKKNGQHFCRYSKMKIGRWLNDAEFYFLVEKGDQFTHPLRSFVPFCFHHSSALKKKSLVAGSASFTATYPASRVASNHSIWISRDFSNRIRRHVSNPRSGLFFKERTRREGERERHYKRDNGERA